MAFTLLLSSKHVEVRASWVWRHLLTSVNLTEGDILVLRSPFLMSSYSINNVLLSALECHSTLLNMWSLLCTNMWWIMETLQVSGLCLSQLSLANVDVVSLIFCNIMRNANIPSALNKIGCIFFFFFFSFSSSPAIFTTLISLRVIELVPQRPRGKCIAIFAVRYIYWMPRLQIFVWYLIQGN